MYYEYKNNELYWKNALLEKITSEIDRYNQANFSYQGPYYIYHKKILEDRISCFESNDYKKNKDNLPSSFFSVKSLSNIHILKIFQERHDWGLDVVSIGEIERAKHAGFNGERIVFAGVGKTENEISQAIHYAIRAFHVESLQELKKIADIAQEMNTKAGIALRINPDIEAKTHAFITTGKEENKFGISLYELSDALSIIKNNSSLILKGLQAHIGSQIIEIGPYQKALEKLIQIEKEIPSDLKENFEYISLGGGFGIHYENPFKEKNNNKEFPVKKWLQSINSKDYGYQIITEPGRFISAYSGALISHVLYNKEKNQFTISITDSGISELIRPALYSAYHPILPLIIKEKNTHPHDIVGPICETGDFFAKKIPMPNLQSGEKIAIAHAGAYSSTMASNYNSRPMVPEFLIEDTEFKIIRKPQSLDQMLQNETSLL